MKPRNPVRLEGDVAYIILENRSGAVVGEALVDTTDAPAVVAFGRWRLCGNGYVYTTRRDEQGKRQDITLHHFLLSPPDGMVVDHIHHNPLDNRRSELRLLTRAENMQNRRGPHRGKPVPYRNVYAQVKGGGYRVSVNGKNYGTYKTPEEAHSVACTVRPKVLEYSNR